MNGNGDGNPRPDLFHDRRGEGRRTAPYAMMPLAKPKFAAMKHGGETFPSSRAALRTPGKTVSFSPAQHGVSAQPGTLMPVTYS